jgi:geranylgeranyl diphosphate synthase type II
MDEKLKEIIATIDKTISELDLGMDLPNLYDPIYYILGLGGKRIRPLLSILAYQLYQKGYDKILKPSLAVEVFHNFTLMHDDIMDQAPLRRNMPTVHSKWNENIAILSGDVMLVRVYDLLLEVEDSIVKEVISKFNNCAAAVCEGQQMDMDFETTDHVTVDEYLNMIRLKTAVLLGFSMELGGLIGGATKEDQANLKQFGINMGIGFQLMDDLLDVYADKEVFGKQVGGDIIANKKTYLLIKSLELAQGTSKGELEKWMSYKNFDPLEKVKSVTSIYNHLDIERLTKDQINYYFDLGLDAFNKIKIKKEQREDLLSIYSFLMNREK